MVAALIKAGCDVDKARNNGCTPLFMAAENGHGEVVAALLKGGCDVDKANNTGSMPLYIAAEKVAKVLIRGGSDVDKIINNGVTPVCITAEKVHGEVVTAIFVLHVVDQTVDIAKQQ